MDMVDYLSSLGFSPSKITGDNYFYLSLLREEKTASFKVNRTKNVWYDHGAGKGGNLVDFVCTYFHCNLTIALQKINETPAQKHSSLQQQKTREFLAEPQENTIRILSVRSPITDMVLNPALNLLFNILSCHGVPARKSAMRRCLK